MKNILIIIAAFIFLTSCASYTKIYSVIPQETSDNIPYNAEKIIVKTPWSPSLNYSKAYKALLSEDYKIEKDNKEMGYILASKFVEGDTEVRLNIICQDSTINITSEWKPGSNSVIMASAFSGLDVDAAWSKAIWTKRFDKPNIAFAKGVQFALLIGNEILYISKTSNTAPIDKYADPLYN